jgi:LMBR1 domain-containing protein 1
MIFFCLLIFLALNFGFLSLLIIFSWWNSFYPFFAMFLSIMGGIVSLLWFLQICIYLLPEAWGGKAIHPFLIAWLEILDEVFPLFATATIGIFVLYLLMATIKGVFKFGMRFTILPMHPMRLHKTLANSIAVNVGMVCLKNKIYILN